MAGGGIKISNIKINGGADGRTPIFKIEGEYLYNSYDNGTTWKEIDKVVGTNGKDGADGKTGAKLVSQVLQGQDAQGGNIYKQTFDDGTVAYFTAPRGEQGIAGEGSSIEVDSSLSSTSENPVQNKVITNKIGDIEHLVAQANTTASQSYDMALDAETLAQGHDTRIGHLEVDNTNNKARLDTIEGDYVKNTTFSSHGVAGILKASSSYGLTMLKDTNGDKTFLAPLTWVDFVTNRNTSNGSSVFVAWGLFDRGVRASLTSNNTELTAEEQALACAWLGATKLYRHHITFENDNNGWQHDFVFVSSYANAIESGAFDKIPYCYGYTGNTLDYAFLQICIIQSTTKNSITMLEGDNGRWELGSDEIINFSDTVTEV